MADALSIDLHPSELEEVVDSVFTTMLGIEAAPNPGGVETAPQMMTATIRLLGSHEGTIRVHCLPAQACEFAGSFLGMPPPESVDDDVRDVLGELANMIAGNLKCTLGPGVSLSIPAVKEDDAHPGEPPIRVYQSGFATPKGPFWMTVLNGCE